MCQYAPTNTEPGAASVWSLDAFQNQVDISYERSLAASRLGTYHVTAANSILTKTAANSP